MNISALGIRSDKVKQFNKKGIETIDDLLHFLPRKYYDFRFAKDFIDIKDGELCSVKMTIKSVELNISASGREYVNVVGVDDKGYFYNVLYFNSSFMYNVLKENEIYYVCGKAEVGNYRGERTITFINPISTGKDPKKALIIKPIYSKINGMSDKFFTQCLNQALSLSTVTYDEYLENQLVHKYKLPSSYEAIHYAHFPNEPSEINKAQRRFIFDDLFLFNYMLERKALENKKDTEVKLSLNGLIKQYLSELPFELTSGQKEVIKSIIEKGSKGQRVSALVQADVGAGKTEVAKITALSAIDSGYQVVVMAPTQILAKQHFEDFKESMKNLNIDIEFVHSNLKKSEKNKMAKKIKSGEAQIIIGTHSVFSSIYEDNKLGMVIVEEEHRFGVAHREKLLEKQKSGVHSISLSATPIPRSLALTIYGDDTELYEIKTLPAFKKPIITTLIKDEFEQLKKLEAEISKGNQAYVVCSLIDDEESSKEDVKSTYELFAKYFLPKGYKVGVVTGQTNPKDAEEVIQKFKDNEIKILISTTVIEVGVNNPNATVIWIRNAEQFGLAQLHQLRGRVGRGAKQGYAWLECKSMSEKALDRMKVLCESNDGFYLAQKDLELRGSGNLIGTHQSGDNKFIELVMSYPKANNNIKEDIKEIFKDEKRRIFYEDRISEKIKNLLVED